MTIDEAIKTEENIAEENQRVVDTRIMFDNVTIDMFYGYDTKVIDEHLANYQRCAEEHRQLAEWLKELKQLREQTESKDSTCDSCKTPCIMYEKGMRKCNQIAEESEEK